MNNIKSPNLKDLNSVEACFRYRNRLIQHDITPEALGWRHGTQEIRFMAFKNGFGRNHPKSILDIGCGFADLYAFLKKLGWDGLYVGIDLVPEFIEISKLKYSSDVDNKTTFICADFMDYNFDQKFEACYASGIFNHRRTTESSDNMEYLFRCLDKMKEISTEYSAVDMLSSTSDRRAPDLYFYEPNEVLDKSIQLTSRILIDHSYMPYEFMLKLYWRNKIEKDWPVFDQL